ncbi:SRPBCC family protein [Nocardia sp. BMG51109]|uniref:SRPBCC family protein n=1 Tax=Nocardia sp. BMG51109 TaxID=1056816 RepID=UPI00046671B1|nr:SRPBCC family protein [Nocardia sp. BMG51109]
MRTVDIETTIRAPAGEVFDWLTDATNYQRVPVVRRVILVRPGDCAAHGEGAVRVVVTPLLRLTEQILEYRPPMLMRYRIVESVPPLRHRDGFIACTQVPRGTRVRWRTEYEIASPVLSRMFTALYAPIIAGGFRVVLHTAARELGPPRRRAPIRSADLV